MIETLRIESLASRRCRRAELRWRIWREWCFARAVAWKLRWRLAAMAALLLGGGTLFHTLGEAPEGERPSFVQAVYYTWALVFGEPPVTFPEHPALEAMFFVVPLLGLIVILEGLVELGLMIRDRKRNEREWCKAMCEALRDHVILVGLGRLGYRTFLLLRRLGVPVVVIERDPNNQFLEDVRRDGSPLLIGDARREILLRDANIMHARSIMLATTDDLANLECALDARAINPEIRVILRMFDQNMAEKVGKGFGIHVSMSQAAISAPAFATSAVDPDVINSVVVDDQLVVMKRWRVEAGGSMAGRTVGQLMDGHEIAVVEWVRPGGRGGAEKRLFPPTHLVLEPGDELIVQGPFDELTRLKGMRGMPTARMPV